MTLCNVGLPADLRVFPQVSWPLLLLPFLLALQLTAPSQIWAALLTAWIAIYAFSFAWVRWQIPKLHFQRHAVSEVLLVGDLLEVESRMANEGLLPLIWCRVRDKGAERQQVTAERIAACASQSVAIWTESHRCQRRGRLQLGPAELYLRDPLGLVAGRREFKDITSLLVHPRIVELPGISSPKRSLSGGLQERRRLISDSRATTIRPYDDADSRHLIHWLSTARHGELMVTDLESEPGTRQIAALNLNAADHVGEGLAGTFEFGVSVAASLVAQTVRASDQRQCGLLFAEDDRSVSVLAPGNGQGHMWEGLRLLADIGEGSLPFDRLLAGNALPIRSTRVQTLLAVSPYPSQASHANENGAAEDWQERQSRWLAELHSARERGVDCGVVLLRHPSQADHSMQSGLLELLAPLPVTILNTDAEYLPLVTHRRTRREYISTPTGGVIAVDVEEAVG